jgi:hypothetical protein
MALKDALCLWKDAKDAQRRTGRFPDRLLPADLHNISCQLDDVMGGVWKRRWLTLRSLGIETLVKSKSFIDQFQKLASAFLRHTEVVAIVDHPAQGSPMRGGEYSRY